MTCDAEVFKLECTLALARCLAVDPQVRDPHTFACSMFFAGIDLMEKPLRSPVEVEADLASARALMAPTPPRKKSNFGACYAQHRSGTDTAPPARRKSDLADAKLDAYMEAEAQRTQDRDRAQRAAAHQHPAEMKELS